ncbi:MAG: PRC-barrel domain-containing protein [Alphaproteobacteria bacterium]
MKLHYLLILLALFTVFSVPAAYAQRNLHEDLTTLNRIQPLQHPDYDTSKEILDRRILERKNKVIGEVDDVVLNGNGNIVSLEVEFDRLGHHQPVTLNYNSMNAEPVTNGYILGFEQSEIEDLYPAMLANVETAAGGEEEYYSLQRLTGTEIRTPDGRRIGKIADVLFGARGDRAEAFYVTMEQGTARGKGIAIPYDVLEIRRDGGVLKATVTPEQAKAMSDFSKNLKK